MVCLLQITLFVIVAQIIILFFVDAVHRMIFFSFSISFFLSCINWRHLRRKLFWRLRKKRCVDEANTKPTESIQEVCDWFMHTSFKSHKQIYMENANAFKYLTLAFDQGMAQFSATHLFAFGISSSSSCLLGMKILLGTLSGWKLVGAQCIMCKNYKLAHEKVKFAFFRCFSSVAANLLFSEMSKWSRTRLLKPLTFVILTPDEHLFIYITLAIQANSCMWNSHLHVFDLTVITRKKE